MRRGAPRFVVQHIEELQQTAFTLEKILDANAHDLKNGTIILVRH
ncbi:capping complex subunit for YIEGIA [Paenibacillus larvae]